LEPDSAFCQVYQEWPHASSQLKFAKVQYINKKGLTQFRVRFARDDNYDGGADYVLFWSGDAGKKWMRPVLIVTYYVP